MAKNRNQGTKNDVTDGRKRQDLDQGVDDTAKQAAVRDPIPAEGISNVDEDENKNESELTEEDLIDDDRDT